MAKDNIKKINSLRCPTFLTVIDKRWDVQISRDLHLAAEWWLQYGGSAKHLKKIVVHALSQTTTSTYTRLEKLVYVHYNMRLRLRCMQEEYDKKKELKTYDPLDASFINDESDPILDWLQDRDNQEDPLLDEPGDPPQPFRIIADEAGISDVERWADENIGRSQGNVQEQTALDEESQNPAHDSDAEFERLMQGPRYGHSRHTQSQSGKKSIWKGENVLYRKEAFNDSPKW
ncbi:hypothetical protein ACMD2_21315 [Ananas comosus]|uniref:HAT C-terminal dimerisation domain-containing protein n=1 Tax=Ananas comosus TaxID=4615 RepID=A0A199V149_ANACO|nr:hypothetical protein ACMD2_21315 [Ananas comosus]